MRIDTTKNTKETAKKKPLAEEHIVCNLCSQNDYSVIYEKIDTPLEVPLTDKFSAAKGILSTDQIVRCNHCGLVYTNPRVKTDLMLSSCAQGDDEVYVSQEEGRKKTFEEGISWIQKKALFSAKDASQKPVLLDVGCAAGFFLAVAKDYGFEPYGVELNSWLSEYGRKKFGLSHVTSGTLEAAHFSSNMFDYVTMWDVLEHVPDPSATLHELARITKPGGYLVISYPDYSSIFAKIFGRKWWFLLSHHIYYFTPTTMEKILAKNGFIVVTDKMHWQKLKIVYMLDMFVKLNKNPLVRAPFAAASFLLKKLRLENISVRYYASQRDVIAQKK